MRYTRSRLVNQAGTNAKLVIHQQVVSSCASQIRNSKGISQTLKAKVNVIQLRNFPRTNTMNILNTENLNSISKLEANGWEGWDVDMTISLYEYGIIWKTIDEPDEDGEDTFFLYEIGSRRWDRCGMSSSTDLAKEYNWADFNSVADMHGITLNEYNKLPFVERIVMLHKAYGYENIFGGSYWQGFTIQPH